MYVTVGDRRRGNAGSDLGRSVGEVLWVCLWRGGSALWARPESEMETPKKACSCLVEAILLLHHGALPCRRPPRPASRLTAVFASAGYRLESWWTHRRSQEPHVPEV
jgi:hypothetical protein